MMSVAIIEDDPFAGEMLVSALREIDPSYEVVTMLPTVELARAFFRTSQKVDLILSDVQLKDGLSFQIFEEVDVHCPIIFISAYDQYMVNAFEYSGIDYLLKPISVEALGHSLNKYKAFENHFLARNNNIKTLINNFVGKRKTRMIVKKGYSFVSLQLSDVVLFYTENLLVYAIDVYGGKYLVDKNLNALEDELDEQTFFRANRQYIVNVNFVQGYKSYERVKLLLTLKNNAEHVIVVGQEKAKSFRKWLAEA